MVDPNTVAPAYRDRETAGSSSRIVRRERYVSDACSPLARGERLRTLTQWVDALIVEARLMNIGLEAVVELILKGDEALDSQNRET